MAIICIIVNSAILYILFTMGTKLKQNMYLIATQEHVQSHLKKPTWKGNSFARVTTPPTILGCSNGSSPASAYLLFPQARPTSNRRKVINLFWLVAMHASAFSSALNYNSVLCVWEVVIYDNDDVRCIEYLAPALVTKLEICRKHTASHMAAAYIMNAVFVLFSYSVTVLFQLYMVKFLIMSQTKTFFKDQLIYYWRHIMRICKTNFRYSWRGKALVCLLELKPYFQGGTVARISDKNADC